MVLTVVVYCEKCGRTVNAKHNLKKHQIRCPKGHILTTSVETDGGKIAVLKPMKEPHITLKSP